MESKHVTALVSGSVGAIGGIVFMASLQGSLPQFLLGMGASLVPIGWVINTIADSRYTPKLQTLQSESARLKTSLKSAEDRTDELSSQYHAIYTQFKCLSSESERDKADLRRLAGVVGELGRAQNKIEELERIKDQYEIDWQEMESGKEAAIEQEIKKRLRKLQKEEIQRIWAESDKHCQNFSFALDEATELMLIFKEKAENAKAVAFSVGESARKFRDEKNKYIEALIEQLELKNSRIALLQQELAGDLNEPEYLKAGYQWDARIADDIARHIWSGLHIPLAVKGYKSNPDGSAEGGYVYSRSQSPEALVTDLSRISGDIAKALNIYEIGGIRKHELSDLLIISWRCERPKPVSEEAVYRMMEPAKNCTRILRDAMDHRKGGKPTLRIMSATGGGKGIIAKVFIADWVKSMSGEVWVSDPMDGSSEDHWEIPKAAKTASEGSKLLSEFSGEFHARKNKISERKGVLVLGVFDEFDKQHPDDDKEKVQEIWTAIRHHDMRLVLIGQSSEVGVNGWQWDMMKNCALLFVGNAITTAIKQAKNIGLSQDSKRQIERTYDAIRLHLEEKNNGLGSDAMYRVALLVVDDTYKFLELPPALKGAVENDKASIVSSPWESFSSVDSSSPAIQDNELQNTLKARICPGCKGKLRKAGNKLRCENPAHTRDMGVKSFPL